MEPHLSSLATASLPATVHATCVAVGTRGLLIVGPSGSGKSSLAVQMLACGAALVADDQCTLSDLHGALMAFRPDGLPKAIEARGLGLLDHPCLDEAQIVAVVDMATPAKARMPERATCAIGPHRVPLLQYPVSAHGPAALYLYLSNGFHD